MSKPIHIMGVMVAGLAFYRMRFTAPATEVLGHRNGPQQQKKVQFISELLHLTLCVSIVIQPRESAERRRRTH
jgi:hypothetical protein